MHHTCRLNKILLMGVVIVALLYGLGHYTLETQELPQTKTFASTARPWLYGPPVTSIPLRSLDLIGKLPEQPRKRAPRPMVLDSVQTV
jgi:hypothetical protein